MTLSPAAQAVLDAANLEINKPPSPEKADAWRARAAAAALRAAVEQVQYEQYGIGPICDPAELLAIATELETHQ